MIKKIMEKVMAKERGYICEDNGKIRRECVLERYYRQGDLELEGSPFEAEKRKKAGEILARDYYLGNYNNLQSIKFFESNIPTTGEYGIELSLYYKNKYLEAMKSVPQEFRQVIYRVCIEDKKIIFKEENNKRNLENKNNIFYQKRLLTLGLERLLKYYLKKNKKSS